MNPLLLTRRQEADIAANIIRTSLSAGMSSHIAYAEPGASESPSLSRSVARRVGRNDPSPAVAQGSSRCAAVGDSPGTDESIPCELVNGRDPKKRSCGTTLRLFPR